MFDQSFSTENLQTIFDIENRKGYYLEGLFFPKLVEIEKEIKELKLQLNEHKKKNGLKDYITSNQHQFAKLRQLKKTKEIMIHEELEVISRKISSTSFEIKIRGAVDNRGKKIYVNEKDAFTFFSLKQIQSNLEKLYQIKQPSRFLVAEQLIQCLDNKFPKYIIRTDIQNFYETIPHEKLLKKIDNDNLLNYLSKRIIQQILKEFKAKSGGNAGVPRGIGASAYLSEMFMKEIDERIRSLDGVTFYCRYVDDIVIVFTPRFSGERRRYLDEVKEIVELDFNLTLNKSKTKEFDHTKNDPRMSTIEYLGLRMTFGNGPLKVAPTKKKVQKYKDRIERVIQIYQKTCLADEKKAKRRLYKILKYLTGNSRLLNNKSKVLIGVYYSNSLVNDLSFLDGLDHFLAHKIKSSVEVGKFQDKLLKLSFKCGFTNRTFHPFSSRELISFKKVWNYEV